MVEFALVLPILILILFGTVDIGRAIFIYASLAGAARDGARIADLQSQVSSDCLTIANMQALATTYSLTLDPKSLVGDQDPTQSSSNWTVPPPGQGYIYIWPAATSASPPGGGKACDGDGSTAVRTGGSPVSVQATFNYQPITPGIATLFPSGFLIRTVATESVIQPIN